MVHRRGVIGFGKDLRETITVGECLQRHVSEQGIERLKYNEDEMLVGMSGLLTE